MADQDMKWLDLDEHRYSKVFKFAGYGPYKKSIGKYRIYYFFRNKVLEIR